MTKIRDIYARDGLTFSIEFFPPKTPEGMDSLFAELQELKKLDPAFVSVTYGAGGTTQSKTLQVVRAMKYREKLEVMCHVTIVNQPLKDVKAVLGDLWGCGGREHHRAGGRSAGGRLRAVEGPSRRLPQRA